MIKTIYFAGGCFWCTEAVFLQLRGVSNVRPGYTGGQIKNPAYREVCSGRTGHAEAISFDYDTSIVSLQDLLLIFFQTHDPTTLNRQGNDSGTQYRSAIYYTSEDQKSIILNVVAELEAMKIFDHPIVTEINEAGPFYLAEVEHHNFYELNKSHPYCQALIVPKLKKLTHLFSKKIA
ncbi:MAG: peptide-methionine (S)-S-oxide reductase MsrA [Flavobacteriaceae bacterium]